MNKISITPLTEKFCEEYIELEFDPDLKRHMGGIPNKSREMMRSQIYAGDYKDVYAIIENATGNFVGRCGFFDIDYEKEIYVAIAKIYWGRKYAKAAIQELIKITGRNNVFAVIDPQNTKSLNLCKSLSFEETGRVKSNDWKNNHIKLKLRQMT
jgi:RimJ/RimL family protein N-acetyltransferase